MSGQYAGGFNSPGHRGQQQFNPQQQQQMLGMNPMPVGGAGAGMQQNPMAAGGMMSMGGYAEGGMMQQQAANMQGGVMNPMGMQSNMASPHAQQMMQQQMQLQQQQMGAVGGTGAAQMNMQAATAGMAGHMQQQQQQAQQQHMPVAAQQLAQANAQATAAGMQQQPQQQLPTQAQQQPPPIPPTSMLAMMPQPNPHKEINIVALSRLGQETVQDITSRFSEIYAALKVIMPNPNRENSTEKKVQEYFRTIRLLFKRVRIIYEKCNDGYPQGMEYANVEALIPYKDEAEHRPEPVQCEEYRKALQENKELIETLKFKNRQLREIIDRKRIIIWEINTMLGMRKS